MTEKLMGNKKNSIKKIVAILISYIFLVSTANAQDSLMLTKKQEKYLSKKTTKTRMMEGSSFHSYAGYLYARDIATIHTDNPEVLNVVLHSFPDPDKEVSPRELFDEIGRQTNSKWTYDPKRDFWLFSKPFPYEIEQAQGWEKEIRAGYVCYKPSAAPVGMDIYFAGRVNTNETPNDARIRLAKKYAAPITPGITADSMKEVTLAHHNALFYQTGRTQKGVIWRQWAIADKQLCFVIVSAIKPDDDGFVFPDVEKMVRSFKVVEGKGD